MKSLDTRVILILIAGVLLALGAWSLKYFGKYRPFADMMTHAGGNGFGQIGLEMSNAIAVGREAGRPKWRLAARKITLSRDRHQITIEGIHDGWLYDMQQRPAVGISAGRAVYTASSVFTNTETGSTLRLDNGIRAVLLHPGGLTVTTESLIWDGIHGIARCPGTTSATFANGKVTAIGDTLQFDVHTQDISLHHLHGTFRVPASVP